jgi:hypothetical protein
MVADSMKPEGIKTMDLNLLRTAVFEKTGIKVDTQDPIFALVALHETVLADSIAHQLNAIDDATARLQQQTEALLAAAEQVKALLLAAGHPVEAIEVGGSALQAPDAPVASPTGWLGLEQRWIAAGAAVAALSAALTMIGIWIMRVH